MQDELVIVVPVLKPLDTIAKDLHTPKYRQRIVKPKKGKGSFKRKKVKLEEQRNELSCIHSSSKAV